MEGLLGILIFRYPSLKNPECITHASHQAEAW